MKYPTTIFILAVILTSCTPVQEVSVLPEATSTAVSVTFATQPPSATAKTTASPTPSLEPTKVPCDPWVADFCITNGHFILQRPIRPPGNDAVDTTYRYASTAEGTRDPHHGVEFLNGFGTPVYAAADGEVLFAGPDAEAVYSPWANFYGNVVVIRHADELFTLYAHLSRIDVQPGQTVTVGEQIGAVGQSGVATGSHLHFEVRRGNAEDYFATQNPELWLKPLRDERLLPYGTLMISIVNEAFQFQSADLTISRYPHSADVPEKVYYLSTYVPEMATGAENAVMSGLRFGRYRIALKYNGHLYERWVNVQSGKLTEVVIVVK
jgi:hypothetical protein